MFDRRAPDSRVDSTSQRQEGVGYLLAVECNRLDPRLDQRVY